MHILWQLPQYVIITAGEIMFSVTGLEFSFTQAPESMKSVLQACWLLAVAFGNIIVVIVAKVNFFKSQASEFFLFFGLMVLDVCLFIYLATRYRYREDKSVEDGRTTAPAAMKQLPSDGAVQRKGFVNTAYSGET